MKTNHRFLNCLICGAPVLALALIPLELRADTVVSTTQPSDLVSALQSGGVVTFGIDGTIVLTNTITISTNVVLDSAGHSVTISGGGAVQLFILPAGLNLALRNLTLANALEAAPITIGGVPTPGYGGAINSAGNLDIENCILTNNSVTSPVLSFYDGKSTYGGAIYNSGNLTISNSLFVTNTAVGGAGRAEHVSQSGSAYGGAIYNAGGSVLMGSVVFTNNSATGGPGISVMYGGNAGSAYGGAIFSSGGNVRANAVQAANNRAVGGSTQALGSYGFPDGGGSAFGGAFYMSAATMAVSNSVFSGNSTTGASANGSSPGQSYGGCVVNSGNAVFSACAFTGNTANGALGETYYNEGSAAAPSLGGAVYNSGNAQILGGFLTGNSAIGGQGFNPADGMGGAVYNSGSMTLGNVTFLRNSAVGPTGYLFANGWGGAIYNTGLITLTAVNLVSNYVNAQNNYGDVIYSAGAFVTDTNSFVIPNMYVTGTPADQWQSNNVNISGATGSTLNLTNVQFNAAGTYTLTVTNSGALVTNIVEILNTPAPAVATPAVSAPAPMNSGRFQLNFAGTPGGSYSVWASADFVNWLRLGASAESSSGRFGFTDSAATNLPRRFYQIRWP